MLQIFELNARGHNLGLFIIKSTFIAFLSSTTFATSYTFPGAAVAPLDLVATDTLSINSGIFATPNNNSASYTVNLSTGNTVTIGSTATLSYLGNNSSASAIQQIRNDTTNDTTTITNNGTLSKGNGSYAIYLVNNNAAAANTASLSILGPVQGSVFVKGISTVILDINGNGTIDGTINLETVNSNLLRVGNNTTCNFVANSAITNVDALRIFNNSVLTLNAVSTNIKNVNIAIATMNLNADISGNNTSIFQVLGTLNAYANISNYTTFLISAGGNANYYKQVSVVTPTYNGAAGTHRAVMTDSINYGKITLASATTASFGSFAVTYNNGYFPTGTYTLVNAPLGITTPPTSYSVPANTLFLTFSTPVADATTVKINISNTPFLNFATTPLTQSVANALDQAGKSNPNAAMLTLLNALTLCTTPNQVQSALQRLAPSTATPMYVLQAQNQMVEPVKLRMANMRASKVIALNTYSSGDLGKDEEFWIRAMGDKANQQARNDTFGYYASTSGLVVGYDRQIRENFLLGIAGAYALANVHDKINNNSYTRIKSYQGLIYGDHEFSRQRYFDWILSATIDAFDANRFVSINGTNLFASSNYHGQVYGAKGILGQDFNLNKNTLFTPEASLQYTHVHINQYSESGALGANLTVAATNPNLLELDLGAKLSSLFNFNNKLFVPEIHAFGLYNIVNGNKVLGATFLQAGTQFNANYNLPRLGVKVGASVTALASDSIAIKINYDHVAMSGYTDNFIYLNIKYLF